MFVKPDNEMVGGEISTTSAPALFKLSMASLYKESDSTKETMAPKRTPFNDVCFVTSKNKVSRGAASVMESFLSTADMASNKMALSVTFFVIGPEVSKELDMGTIPVRLTIPMVGFRPTTAFFAEGDNIDPDVSEPKAATA